MRTDKTIQQICRETAQQYYSKRATYAYTKAGNERRAQAENRNKTIHELSRERRLHYQMQTTLVELLTMYKILNKTAKKPIPLIDRLRNDLRWVMKQLPENSTTKMRKSEYIVKSPRRSRRNGKETQKVQTQTT